MRGTYCDAFFLSDTHGLPLSLLLEQAKEFGMDVSLPQFFVDAIRAGWKTEKAIATIREALVDTGCSPEYVESACMYLGSMVISKKRRK